MAAAAIHASEMNRVVGLLLVACIALPLALFFYVTGSAPYGLGWPGGSPEPCIQPEALPSGAQVAARNPSSDAATIQYTTVPLGLICTVQLVNPDRIEVLHHQSWPATIAWLGFATVGALALVAVVLHGWQHHRRWSRSTTSR